MLFYVHCNPITSFDPLGLWNIGKRGTHEAIAGAAYVNVGEPWSEENFVEFVNGASKKSDMTWEHFFDGGASAFKHSTAPPGIVEASAVKQMIINQALELWDRGPSDYESLGVLQHMLADSYCPSHVERDENGNIEAFLDFYGENGQMSRSKGLSKHKEMDIGYNDGRFTKLAFDAVMISEKLIKLNGSDNRSRDDFRDWLENEVLPLSENAKVYEGEAWSDMPFVRDLPINQHNTSYEASSTSYMSRTGGY